MKKTFLTFLIIFISVTFGFSQSNAEESKNEIVPTIQMLHSNMIQYSDTWNQKNLLLTANSSEIILWNTQTGLVLREIKSRKRISGAVFCNEGNEIAVLFLDGDEYSSLRFYDSHTGKKLKDSLIYFNAGYGANKRFAKFITGLVRNREGSRLMFQSDEIFMVDAKSKTNSFSFKTPQQNYSSFNANNLLFTDNENEFFFVLSSNNNYVAYLLNKNGEVLKQGTAIQKRAIAVALAKDGFYILEGGGNIIGLDKNLMTKRTISQKKEITFFGAPKFAGSDDGKKLVVALNESCRVYDLEKQQWINKSLKLNCDVIACTTDASKLAFLYYETAKSTAILVQTVSGELSNDDESISNVENISHISFSKTGKVMWPVNNVGFDGLDLQNGEQLNKKYVVKQWLSDSVALCIYKDVNGLGTNQIQIRNLFTDKILYAEMEKVNDIFDATISPDKQTIVFLTNNKDQELKYDFNAPVKMKLHILSGNDFANTTTENIQLRYKTDSRLLISPDSRYLSLGAPHQIKLFDLKKNKWKILPDTSSNRYLNIPFFFSHDGKRLSYQIDFMGKENGVLQLNFVVKTVDLESGEVKSTVKLNGSISHIAIHPTLDLYAIAYYDGLIEVRKTEGDEIVFKKNTPEGLMAIAFHPSQKWLITNHNLTEMSIINYGTNKQLVKAYKLANDGKTGFGLFTPENYYMVPSSNVSGVHYVKDLETYSFTQFDFRFNRPDKVLTTLNSLDTALIHSYKKAYEKRIKKLGIDTTLFNSSYSVPKADFSNRKEIVFDQKETKLLVKIKAEDRNVPLDRLNIWINEVPVYGLKGINLKAKKRLAIDTAVVVDLSEGANKIETSVVNTNGVESYRIPLKVSYSPSTEYKAKMYFIGIGINNFEQNEHNLRWSVKDIKDLALKLKEKYKDDIKIDTLFDQNVTRERILSLKAQLKKTDVNDKVILAYSGHGLLNGNYDYFLSTYGIDFNHPEIKGLAYDSFEDLVDGIPARQKLMLIDACHSGEVDKDELVKINQSKDNLINAGIIGSADGNNIDGSRGVEVRNISKNSKLGMKNSFELMQSLFANISKGTGATIISAAGGMQYALEKNSLKNGVFTYSILELMKDNETLGIKELKEKVNLRVVELTNGLQQPTSRSENSVIDWDVW